MAQPHPKPTRAPIHRASDDLVVSAPITLTPYAPLGEGDAKHRAQIVDYLRATLDQTRLSATTPSATLTVSVRAVDAVGERFFLRVAPVIAGAYGRPTTVPLTEEVGLVTDLRLFFIHDSATARDGQRSTNLVVEVPRARSHAEMAQRFAQRVQQALRLEATPLIIEF